MKYEEWLTNVPADLTGDPLWSLQLYRLALYAGDVAWDDALILSKTLLTRDLANQLYRAVCSISVNLAEGYSRSTGKDRAHYLEYALGSAREARDWYHKARHILKQEIVADRLELLTRIIKILSVLTPQQREKGLRERSGSYDLAPDSELPVAEPEADPT